MGIQKFGNITLIHLSDIDSNIYVIGDTVIDTGTGFNYTRLRDVMKMLKMPMSDVKWIINTHCHFDHIGGNGYFLNAKIAAHEVDANIIETGNKELSAADFFDGNPHPKVLDKKLKDGDVIKAGSTELQVIHTPGHTTGSICLYDKKNQFLFSGDTVFENAIGRVDFSNSDPTAMKESLQKLSKLAIKKVFPGHGSVFDKAKLDKVLKTNVEQFQHLVEEGEIDDDYV
ncbi:MAG: MBL fold metallo-hydrolase [Candidatus Aenigmatarchaeota archaeon]|nr:MBL fold metallo-hydrolase [Nanoarchaeota archaeon]